VVVDKGRRRFGRVRVRCTRVDGGSRLCMRATSLLALDAGRVAQLGCFDPVTGWESGARVEPVDDGAREPAFRP